jgi:DNA polymerase I
MERMAHTERKRLFLIDGMSQIYRAYYAIRGLTNSQGLPTNAVYGFTMMLRRLISQEKPDYLGVALDSPEPTFRHESYEHYKATRAATPYDLAA